MSDISDSRVRYSAPADSTGFGYQWAAPGSNTGVSNQDILRSGTRTPGAPRQDSGMPTAAEQPITRSQPGSQSGIDWLRLIDTTSRASPNRTVIAPTNPASEHPYTYGIREPVIVRPPVDWSTRPDTTYNAAARRLWSLPAEPPAVQSFPAGSAPPLGLGSRVDWMRLGDTTVAPGSTRLQLGPVGSVETQPLWRGPVGTVVPRTFLPVTPAYDQSPQVSPWRPYPQGSSPFVDTLRPALGSVRPVFPQVPDLVSLFDLLDKNRDGRLSTKELGLSAINGLDVITGQEVLSLRALHHYRDKIAGLAHSGGSGQTEIARNDVVLLAQLLDRSKKNQPMSENEANLAQAFFRDLATPDDASLYSNQSDPLRSIVPEACQQLGGDGNCHFVSALASLAASDPQRIYDMIRNNGNHTYIVSFPGADHPVTVMAAYGGNNNFGNWPQVMQQAYRSYYGYDMNDEKASVNLASFSLASGNDDGLRLLTGKGSIEHYECALNSLATLDQKLKGAMAGHRPIVTGIAARGLLDLGCKSPILGLPNSHAYSVLEYQSNPADPARSVVTIRNPWGRTSMEPEGGTLPDGVVDHGQGVVSMPLSLFAKEFAGIALGSIPGRQDSFVGQLSNNRDWTLGGSGLLSIAAVVAGQALRASNPALATGLQIAGASGFGATRYSAGSGWAPALASTASMALPLIREKSPGAAGLVASGVGLANLYQDFSALVQTTRSDTRFRSGVLCLADLTAIAGGIAMFTPARKFGVVASTVGLMGRTLL